MLHVRDLRKRFVLHLRDGIELPVLRGVSLSVAAGECVALVGASGQGKSTLVKCLYGSYGIDSGEVLLRSSLGTIDLARAGARQVLALRRRDIACVSQFLRALPRVAAIDVVAERALAAIDTPAAGSLEDDDDPHTLQLAAARQRASALLQRLGIPASLWQLPPATFSGGEQQRVNLARGFIEPARLLLLDEPTASLDSGNRAIVVQLIREAKAAGSAVVGIFHDEEVRDAVATRCVHLHR